MKIPDMNRSHSNLYAFFDFEGFGMGLACKCEWIFLEKLSWMDLNINETF